MDRAAFAELVEPHLSPLRSFVVRMVGQPDDAADLVQEAQLRAFTRIDTYRRESSFRTWLFSIAANLCLDHLRARKRWRPEAQIHAQQDCESSDEKMQELVGAIRDPAFAYDVREHIAFCFTCVARSLPPEQQAALVLREVFQLSNREAADALGLSESVLRHHLSAARSEMERHFDGLCVLVNKQGVCYQCKGLRDLAPESRQGPEVPALPRDLDPRLDAVRRADLASGASRRLHELLYRRIAGYEEQQRAGG